MNLIAYCGVSMPHRISGDLMVMIVDRSSVWCTEDVTVCGVWLIMTGDRPRRRRLNTISHEEF